MKIYMGFQSEVSSVPYRKGNNFLVHLFIKRCRKGFVIKIEYSIEDGWDNDNNDMK